MITIIAGQLNEGKTSTLLKMYNTSKQGDGFACIKVIENNLHTKYNFYRLSNHEEIPFMVKLEYLNDKTYYNQTFKNYAYCDKALNKVKDVIEELIKNKIEPIYLDEVGLLEITGFGHDETLRLLLDSHLDIIITVRDKFIDKVISNYHLNNYRIVGVQDE